MSGAAVEVWENNRASYSASISGLVVAAAATDFLTIQAAQGRLVKVCRVYISGIATAAAAVPITVIKRSTLDTGGTSTTLVNTAFDSKYATSGVAQIKAYTVNPGALGTLVGTLQARRIVLMTAAAASPVMPYCIEFDNAMNGLPTIRGATEQICLNYGGSTNAGNALDLTVEWVEEFSDT